MKLVAGVLGLGLDELVQRDAQRRVRRVTAVTVAACGLVLALSASTVVALQARAEAERRRVEAEGLVEFMLTDLRTRLKGVGRLDVMSAVNARALSYYREQDLGRLPSSSLERRARLLQAMGEAPACPKADLLNVNQEPICAANDYNEARPEAAKVATGRNWSRRIWRASPSGIRTLAQLYV